MLVHKK